MRVGDLIPDSRLGPQEEAVVRDEVAVVRAACQSLPARERYIVSRRMKGDTHRSISKAMGCSKTYIQQLEAIAHRRLRWRLWKLTRE